MVSRLILRVILYSFTQVLRLAAWRHASLAAFMRRRDCIAQLQLRDGSIGRHYIVRAGTIRARAGLHSRPDVTISFRDVPTALSFLVPPVDQAEVVHAAKTFRVVVDGPDPLVVWFMQLLNMIQTAGLRTGRRLRDGTTRYTTNTNGGPLFVYVRAGRIIRTTPIDLDRTDAPSWSLQARGRRFSPRRQATVSPHALTLRSLVDSDRRLLYPMKRVDFDPNGERHVQRRGVSGYVRISWEEALQIVSSEIKRMKREHGPGAMALYPSSHHQWGNVGYYLSAMLRFGNLLGFTRVHPNPDSWEGWYWGAMHHFGNSLRVGIPGPYGVAEDCLKNCELIVYWSSDPEKTSGAYAGSEGTERRRWTQELGIPSVHIDPFFNATAQLLGGKWIAPRPGTDAALAAAIMYVWVREDLYDKEYVRTRTTGFEQWRDYLLGKDDGTPKTPEWQEPETGVSAATVRALARLWGTRRTHLAAGGAGLGGAGRSATGAQWARSMILLLAMQGWGKPGVNSGGVQSGTPLDFSFYFPGYADGGISGELNWTSSAVLNYTRMPHLLTLNPVKQLVPRQRFPEAIIEGRCEGYAWDGISLEAQFAPFAYPMPGYSKIHMLYRYGGSSFGTLARSGRLIEAYRHPSLEFVVNQSIWREGEAEFADIILPACTQLERWDIGEWAGAGGYAHDAQAQLNHRLIVMQHKCIEPRGESRSDYQIFLDILSRLGLGAVFSEGCSELDWCKRVFDSSDLPKRISWQKFLEKGYYVVPPAESEALHAPPYLRWYAEGRKKDVPEPHPLPSQYAEEFGLGLQTPSGKIEFVPETLRRNCPDSTERPPLNRYLPSWEGPHTSELVARYPLQLISTHSRYSFHTYSDGKNAFLNAIPEHRVRIGGYCYWVININPGDARARNIRQHDLVRVFNERASVICAADVTPAVRAGVLKGFESSAEVDFIDTRSGLVDRGGCLNLLTPDRRMIQGTEGVAGNSCLVEIEPWDEAASRSALARERA